MAFMTGAATSAIMINWGRRRRAQSEYALPLMLEAVLLLVFGLLGSNLENNRTLFVLATVALLCYAMGLQNAIITKISKAEIRTTHMTGIVTDIGIELGKLFYWNVSTSGSGVAAVKADQSRLWLLASLLGMFFTGGLAGALGFKYVGFISTLPLSAMLVVLAVVPLMDDLVGQRR
ncbi:MAG: Putative transmembrane protein [Candidatus Burkholderia crenata]|nr:MAG: Putative transmembrane protein [Candidatus Burkholderia crenata]